MPDRFRNRALLDMMADEAEVGTWVLDLATGDSMWNAWHSSLFGFPAEPCVRRYEEFRDRLHPDEMAALEAKTAEAIATRSIFRARYRIIWPDGTIRHVRGQGRVLESEPSVMVGVVFDVTEAVEAHEREQALRKELADADERVRRSVASDIHDGPLQQLFVAKLTASGLARTLDRDGALDASSSPRLARVETSLERAQLALRSLLAVLAPVPHDGPLEIGGALSQLAGDVLADSTWRAEVRCPDDLVVPAAVAGPLLQIVGEAVANARKHSGGSRVEIVVRPEVDDVVVDVSDDGAGFDTAVPAPHGHFGRSVMRARAAAAGGTLETTSAPGGGTTVRLVLPVPANA